MDRRRRPTSAPNVTAKSSNTRRKQLVLHRLLSQRETTYAILSLVLLMVGLIAISLGEAGVQPKTVYPPLAVSSSVAVAAPESAPQFFASGSAKVLRRLLQNITVSHNSSEPRLIVTIAVNYAYRNLALNFICNLRRLKIPNYLVLAMDRAVFDYLVLHKANVFFHDLDSTLHRRLLQVLPQEEGDKFGSAAFVETSRRKSLLVLKVLRLGYSIVFSDVDVIWVTNPIPSMQTYQADFVLQSDRAYHDADAPLNYNLNSGLYLARSSPRAVTTLQAIIRYAQAIRRTEQKAFNYVLCGAFKDHHSGPGLRVGANECTYTRAGAKAVVLPLDEFPNGSDESLWQSVPNFSTAHPRSIAVHANYVSGRGDKVDRIRRVGYWFFSDKSPRKDGCAFPPGVS